MKSSLIRTMAMSVRNHFDFSGVSTCSMIAFKGLQETLVEETILLLRRSILFKIMVTNIQRTSGDRINIGSCIALLAVTPIN